MTADNSHICHMSMHLFHVKLSDPRGSGSLALTLTRILYLLRRMAATAKKGGLHHSWQPTTKKMKRTWSRVVKRDPMKASLQRATDLFEMLVEANGGGLVTPHSPAIMTAQWGQAFDCVRNVAATEWVELNGWYVDRSNADATGISYLHLRELQDSTVPAQQQPPFRGTSEVVREHCVTGFKEPVNQQSGSDFMVRFHS